MREREKEVGRGGGRCGEEGVCVEEGRKINIDINAALYCAVRMYMCMCVKKTCKKEKSGTIDA